MLIDLVDTVKSKVHTLLNVYDTWGQQHARYYIISHAARTVEDRNGTVGLHTDLGEWQRWSLVAAGTHPGRWFIVSHRGQNLEDRNGALGLHGDRGLYQTWSIMIASEGEYAIISHRGQKLEDQNGALGLVSYSGAWSTWSIHCPASLPPFQCFARLPTGCKDYIPNTRNPHAWFDDAAGNAQACAARSTHYNTLCERTDATTTFRHRPPSSQASPEPHCWVRMPTNCPNQPNSNVAHEQWFVDPQGFSGDPTTPGAQTRCAKRIFDHNAYCGRTDTEISLTVDHSTRIKLLNSKDNIVLRRGSSVWGDNPMWENGTLHEWYGWIPKSAQTYEWYEMILDTPMMVVAVVTQGRPGWDQWVTQYKVEVEDTVSSPRVTVIPSTPSGLVGNHYFEGNNDSNGRVIGWFGTPVRAQVVRIIPVTHYGHPVLRAGLLVNAAASTIGTPMTAAEVAQLPQFAQVTPGEGYLYTIRSHQHKGKYLSMTTRDGYGSIPRHTVFLSDEKIDNDPSATSQWHFKWHSGLVRIVGRNTRESNHEGLALYKAGKELGVTGADGYTQHYWDITYKGPTKHGTNRFQIAFACNFANGECEGKGNEIVGLWDSNTLRIDDSNYNSINASWWEIGEW